MGKLLIFIECPDRTGIIAAVTGHLFDVGADLGETAFAAVGGRAEFSTECTVPDGTSEADLRQVLAAIPEVAGGTVRVSRPDTAGGDRATHRIIVAGGNRPGLIARLSEAFVQFDVNILRLDASLVPGGNGDRYVTRFAVAIPPHRTQACLATVSNTAGELGLTCHWEEA